MRLILEGRRGSAILDAMVDTWCLSAIGDELRCSIVPNSVFRCNQAVALLGAGRGKILQLPENEHALYSQHNNLQPLSRGTGPCQPAADPRCCIDIPCHA